MPTIDNVKELRKHLEQIQSEFDKDLLNKLNTLLSAHQGQNVVVTPDVEKHFNEKYNQFVAEGQKKAQEQLNDLRIDNISAADLSKVDDLLIPYHTPRARDKMKIDQSAGISADQGSRYQPMDIFANADESPNDRPQPKQPTNPNRDEISEFLNKQTNDLKNRLTLKFGMPKPRPGARPEEPRLVALPKPRPF